MRKLINFILVLGCLIVFVPQIHAQSPGQQETLEGTVTQIDSSDSQKVMGIDRIVQKIEVIITKGSKKGKSITIDTGETPTANTPTYKDGDTVVVLYSQGMNGKDVYFISDYVRRTPLYILTAIFILLTIFIGRWRGLSSILGMISSFLIIFLYIIPNILKGQDPVLTSVIGSFFIIPITFYLSHGINRKTTVAVIGTILSLILTGVLAHFFVEFARLSGFADENAAFVQALIPGNFNMQGLLLAGIIIGVSGILDDSTISQSSLIEQLHNTDKMLSFSDLYKKGMDVGRDHIASLVNTLVLVYAGASLPLLILFVNNPHPFSEIINYETIANEIVRTLVGSIGLILAVPLTTFISCIAVNKFNRNHSK